jgi:hypothetical protein
MDGCGVSNHEGSCLCDVIIKQHAPIVDDSVNNMWMGAVICDIRGHGVPWTKAGIVAYLDDLVTAYDAWTTQPLRSMFNPLVLDMPNRLDRWKTIRREVCHILSVSDAPLVEILDVLNVSIEDFSDTITIRRGTTTITRDMLVEMEDELMKPNPLIKKIARDYGINASTLKTLHKYYEQRRIKKYGSFRPTQTMLYDMALQVDEYGEYIYTPPNIVKAISDTYGVKYSPSAVSHTRRRKKLDASGL